MDLVESYYKQSFSGVYPTIGSTIKKNATLRDFLSYRQEDQVSGCKASHNSIYSNPQVVELTENLKAEASANLYANFISEYLSPTGQLDILYRLGKVKAVRAVQAKSLYTDALGRMYTRSAFTTDFYVASKPFAPAYKSRYSFTNLLMPPYRYGGQLAAVNDDVNSNWRKATSNTAVQSDFYNLQDFKVDRANLTYREPAFKAINDNIEFLQWVFEGISGIVSTYLTEWDLSIYMQEGIIATKSSDGKTIPTINLRYRMLQDNPSGYRDARAYTFGVVNAATSKWSLDETWDVAAYPLSMYWVPRDDAIAGFYSYEGAQPPSYPGCTPSYEYFKQLKYVDRWNAFSSTWTDWSMPYYKALYYDNSDGLSDADLAYFSDEEPSSYASTMIEASSSTSENYWKSRKRKYGSGKSVVTKANQYASAKNWIESTPQDESYSTPLGVPVRNPVLYGGPHGKDLSPKTPQSFFDEESAIMRNVPRMSGTGVSFDEDNLLAYYTNRLNRFYFHPALKGEPVSQAAWNDMLRWKCVGHRLGGAWGVPRNTQDGWAGYVGAISQVGTTDASPHIAVKFLKEGLSEMRPYLTAYSVQREVCPSVVLYDSDDYRDNYYYYHDHYYGGYFYGWSSSYFNRRRWPRVRPSGSWVYNTISGRAEWQPYRYYGDVCVYTYTVRTSHSYYSNDSWRGWNYRSNYYSYETRTVAYQRAIQTQYAYGIAYKYMHHSEPDANWVISPFQIYDWDYSPALGAYIILLSMLGYLGRWLNLRANVPSLLRACQTRYRLTVPSSWVTGIRSFQGFTMVYRASEVAIANSMVRNHRGLGNQNRLIFVGPGSNPDFIFRTVVTMKEFIKDYTRYHSHRSHRCHHHYSYAWFEYIDVDLSNNENLLAFTGLSRVEDNYRSDIFENLDLQGAPRGGNSIYDYFSGGELSGQGLLCSFPGFFPGLISPPGNNSAQYGSIAGYANARLRDIPVPRYVIGGYHTGAYVTAGGFVAYSDSHSLESWAYAGALPDRIKNAFFNAFTSATFYRVGEDSPVRVSVLYPLRVLWAQVNYQIAMLEQARQVLGIVTPAGIKSIIDKGVDPKTNKVCSPSRPIGEVFQKADFNPYYRQAISTFSGDSSVVSNALSALNTRLAILTDFRDWCEGKDLSPASSRVGRPVFSWTYNEIVQAFSYIESVESALRSNDSLVEFFNLYLNVLYEYRKYFVNKRFNKNDGTYYALRHLEVLALVASKYSALTEAQSLASASDSPSYKVAYYDVQNSITAKAKALLGTTAPLSSDRITAVYVKVEYPEEAITTAAEAAAWEKANKKTLIRTAYNTSMVSDLAEFDEARQWAIKPVDGIYRLTSKEFTRNENAKNTIASLIEAGSTDLTSPVVYDIDQCITKHIVWKDVPENTLIYRGNMTGVSLDRIAEYQAAVTPADRTAYDMMCYSKETQDYWRVPLTGATVACPRAEGYINDVMLEPYAPSASAITEAEVASTGVMAGILWPVTEEQATLIPGIGDQVEEVKKALTAGITALDSQ